MHIECVNTDNSRICKLIYFTVNNILNAISCQTETLSKVKKISMEAIFKLLKVNKTWNTHKKLCIKYVISGVAVKKYFHLTAHNVILYKTDSPSQHSNYEAFEYIQLFTLPTVFPTSIVNAVVVGKVFQEKEKWCKTCFLVL